MNVIGINGSPRPNFNTAKLVKEALRGAEECGAETEYVDLYKMDFKGCISCFACKRVGRESGVCCVKDALHPLLERISQADALIFGSPIYFGDVTSLAQALLERLAFPALNYDDFSSNMFTGSVNAAGIFTMNAANGEYYQDLINQKMHMLGMLHGKTASYASTFTVQFKDYSKYHAAGLNGPERIAQQPERFGHDLEEAFRLGRLMCER